VPAIGRFLTPNKPTPRDRFGDVAGKSILCFASGGGQQGPILSAAGAKVVVFGAWPAGNLPFPSARLI